MNPHFFCKSNRLLRTAFVLSLCAAPLAYSQKLPLTLNRGDSSFVKDAGEGGMDEVKLGQLANYKILSNKTGAEFDKAYISDMVKDHEEDVAAFEKKANSGADEDIKAFASKALPTLQEHLKMAQDIARELGVSVK